MPVLGSSGVSSSLIPAITATPSVTIADPALSRIAASLGTGNNTTTLPGFSENGDYIFWNQNATGSDNKIEYYDNTDTLQWTVNETDVDAGAYNIAFICKVGPLIYGISKATGTTDGFVFTVNSSGTVNNLATITLKDATDGSYEPRDCWFGKIYGENNLYFTAAGTANAYEINVSTGAIVTTASSTGSPNFGVLSFFTSAKIGANLNYVRIQFRGMPTGDVGQSTINPWDWGNSNTGTFSERFIFNNANSTIVNNYKLMYWDGIIYTVGFDQGLQSYGPIVGYDHKDVDDYFVSLINIFGLNNAATWS